MNKKITLAVAALFLLIIAMISSLPYITLWQMKQAVDAHDDEKLASYVAFSSVRQSLKNQLQQRMLERLDATEQNTAIATMGKVFSNLFIDGILEAYITPEGLAQLMLGQDPKDRRPEKIYGKENPEKAWQNAKFKYHSHNRFSITSQTALSEQPVKFILRREGLSWRLAEVILP